MHEIGRSTLRELAWPAHALPRAARRVRGVPLVLLLLVTACAGYPGGPPFLVSEVVETAQGGAPAEEIVARMRAGGGVYRLRASELARLREQGVPDEVIDYMQETWLEQVRREAWFEGRELRDHGPFCDGLLRRY